MKRFHYTYYDYRDPACPDMSEEEAEQLYEEYVDDLIDQTLMEKP